MEVSSSPISNCAGEGNALRGLLQVFGSMFTFEEIASAYCNASKNADLAGQILCHMQSSSSSSSSAMSNDEVKDEVSLDRAYADIPKNSCNGTGKQIWRPVSTCTVIGGISKDYVNPSPCTSMLTFKEKTSVYCNASKNSVLAGQIHCDMQGSSTSCSSSSTVVSNGEQRDKVSLDPVYSDIPKKSCNGNGKSKTGKQIWRPSTVIGGLTKDYVIPSPVTSMLEKTSVYCNASKNSVLAGQIHCDMQGSSTSSSSSSTVVSNGEERDKVSLDPVYSDIPKKSCNGNGKSKTGKQIWRPSTVIGGLTKDYVIPSPVTSMLEKTSVYCNASKNSVLAGQIHCDMQGSSTSSSSSSTVVSNGEERDKVSLDPVYSDIPKKSCNGNRKSKTRKQIWLPSTVIGGLTKDYVNPSPVTSMFTFEEANSVYCKAGQICCDMQGSSSSFSFSSSSVMSNGEVRDEVSLDPAYSDIPKKSSNGNGKSKTGKQIWRPSTVTGGLTKDYVNSSPVTSMFSFEETTSVYCNANKNAALAGQIRYDLQGSSSSSSSSVISNGEVRDEVSFDPMYADIPKKSCNGNGKSKTANQIWRPSTVIGGLSKDYVNPSPVTSMFTFEETASVYCNASKNAAFAGQIRCDMQGSYSSSSSSSSSVMSNGDVRDEVSLDPAYADISKKSCNENGKSKTGKQIWFPVSMHTVTGVLSKDYVNPSPVTSMFTFEKTASGFSNAAFAGQVRCDMQGSSSSSSVISNGEVRDDVSLEPPDGYIPEKSCDGNGKWKQKWLAVSMGTVTGVLGKNYVNPSPVTNSSWIATKPFKLDVKEASVPGVCEEATNTNLSKEARMHEVMEDFLFGILGDVFKLDRQTIRKVLDTQGYDIGKSMDKLIDISAAFLDQKNEYAGKSTQKFLSANLGVAYHHKKGQASTSHGGCTREVSNPSEENLQEKEEARHKLGQDVLTALFCPADRSGMLPRRIAKTERRGMPYSGPVVAPPHSPILNHEEEPVSVQQPDDYDEGDESYQLLLKAVRENRVTMREYYKAAVVSFVKGDNDRAYKLMEKGHTFREKALEADNESSQMIFGRNDDDSKDEIKLDLLEHDAKEAIRTLKCHLSSLAGIPSFKYLKLIVDANGEDSTKGARKRYVVKLLEKESIKWTEGTDAGTIMIHLENINPRNLSFVSK